MIDRRRSAWRFSVPLVCLLAGLLLAATHGVSGGTEIRRSDAPRLVDLVRRAQASVNRLATEREALTTRIDSVHGRSVDTALAAMQRRSAKLAGVAAMNPVHGRAWWLPCKTRNATPTAGFRATRPGRSGCASARHRGCPQRVVECRC